MMQSKTALSWVCFLFITIIPALQPVLASSTGITTYSGNPNVNSGSTCTLCHTGGLAPAVSLTGPHNVEAGSINAYSLIMSGGQENLAGLNISANSGFLSASSAAIVLDGGELRHSQPFTVASSGGQWSFSFEAPASPGTVTIYASVLSANGNGQMSGDNAASVTLAIEVAPAQKKLVPKATTGGPYFGQPGENIQFYGGNSTDGDGTIDRYLWDFGDGSDFPQGATIAHSYSAEGTYTVTLAVTDNDGLTGAAATSVTVSSNAGSAQGEALYNQKCFACHGAGGSGGSAKAITGATVNQIDTAIGNVSAMLGITLTAEETQFIVDFLVSGGSEPPVRPVDGPGLYGMFCSACHGPDGRGGSEIGVTGSPFPMINEAIANVAQMQGIELSLEETQKVADFLTAGGAGNIPTDNKELYDVFCSVCHGIGAHGDKFKAVTGASQQMVTEAISQISWMQSLALDQTQIQSIADYLTAGGEPPLPTDGVALYGTFCAICHGSGGHGGKFKAVTGASEEMISGAINGEPWMSALQITAGQQQQIAAYLGAGGEPPQPSTGGGLYEVFCAVCHGAGGHGGKFKAVTGASNEMITEAIINEAWMDALQLTPGEQQQIADYLGAGGEPPLPVDDAGLYGVFCEVCHGPGGRGGKFIAVTGAPASMINNAITSELWMKSIAATQSQIDQIAAYLTMGGGGPIPNDGAGIYQVFCSVCHGLDGRGGNYKVVTGSSPEFVNGALNSVGLMQSLPLNSSQVQTVAGYLAAGGGGSKPTDGMGLYNVYCRTCHGPNGSGGPEKKVSGASESNISRAIEKKSQMRHLQPYLTTSGSQNDAALISDFLNGQ